LTTIAYQLDGQRTYALEGSIFIAGAAVQWLRDGLGVIRSAAESTALAAAADPAQDVILVPAFTGLGAPHWVPEARGALFGLTRNTGPAELARAALLSVACQTHDLVAAAFDDWAAAQPAAVPTSDGTPPAQAALEARLRHDPLDARLRQAPLDARLRHDVLRVDGGMAASDFTMQALADILDAPVERPRVLEATAVGVAWLAGSAAGLMPDRDAMARNWSRDRRFEPQLPASERTRRLDCWRRAVAATIAMSRSD
ncbi:MAG: FGGY-family carbohydrate kinase, partial [Hyphomicrobium sp.]